MTSAHAETDDWAMSEAELDRDLDLTVLSPRENDVLGEAVQGLSARDIARRLSLTEATVRSHLSATYSKLGVSGRVELLARMDGTAGAGTWHAADGDERRSPTDGTSRGKPMVNLRTLSLLAYTLVYGAIWGFGSTGADSDIYFVWLGMAFVGSTLIWLKNRRIGDKRLRARIYLTDLAVLAAALVITAVLPGIAGMLKGPVLLALFCGYAYWYFRTLEARGLE